jgi:hypothetical protein
MSTVTKIYSPTPPKDNPTPQLKLYDLADKKVWVAWRTELRGGNKTKVPYTWAQSRIKQPQYLGHTDPGR